MEHCFWKANGVKKRKLFFKQFHVRNDSSSRPFRAFSFWRLTNFNRNGQESIKSNSSRELAGKNVKLLRYEPARHVYHLSFLILRNEPASHVFQTFPKFRANENTKTSILFIALLDVLMATLVNLLTTEQSIGPDTEITSTVNKDHVVGTMNEAEKAEGWKNHNPAHVVDANISKLKDISRRIFLKLFLRY